MPTYLIIAQILVAVALIAVILFQVKGGGLGGIFGQPDSVYRTRRGVEKSLSGVPRRGDAHPMIARVHLVLP